MQAFLESSERISTDYGLSAEQVCQLFKAHLRSAAWRDGNNAMFPWVELRKKMRPACS
jgi:hypothetical protein